MASEVVPFKVRRTYIDECRERGVYQKREEMLSEIFQLKTEISSKRKEEGAPVVQLGNPYALDHQKAEMRRYVFDMIDTFAASGLSLAYHGMMRPMIEAEVSIADAVNIFLAAASDRNRVQSAAD